MSVTTPAVAADTLTGTGRLLTIALAVLALIVVAFIVQENGYVLPPEAASFLHEATHDARHALGVPCH